MSRLLIAGALTLCCAGVAKAQYPVYAPYGYGYGYAVPVVPVTPQPYTSFSNSAGSWVVSPGYTSFSNGAASWQVYSPYAAQARYPYTSPWGTPATGYHYHYGR